MGPCDAIAHRAPLRAHPGQDPLVALKKSDVLARTVARCGDRQCLQVAFANQVGQALERYDLIEQFPQWRVVQQGFWFLVPPSDRKSTRLNSSHANISYA